jgi:hypothetical protein
MGGREIEVLAGDGVRLDAPEHQAQIMSAVTDVVRQGAMVLPCFAKGCGPFGGLQGAWVQQPENARAHAAAIALYAALMTHTSLDLIGAQRRILVEGRFAMSRAFTGALASLRPCDTIYVAEADNDVSFGALRLVNPAITPPGGLAKVPALDVDLLPYAHQWRQMVAQREGSA